MSGTGTAQEDEDLTDGIDNTVLEGALDLEATGLTKNDLRKLILASYVTQSTTDTELGIEIPLEELQEKLTRDEIEELKENKETEPDEAGYYYVYFEDEITGNSEFYTATRGSIKIENESGEQLICVNNATFDYYKNWFNGDNINESAAVNTTTKMYTVKEIGTIELLTATRNAEGDYTFSSTTMNYAENSEVQYCMVPLELLMDFLQISASPSFIEAYEKLIINQDIVLRLYALTTTVETQTVTEYPIDITVNVDRVLAFRGRRASDESERIITENIEQSYIMPTFNTIQRESQTTETTSYQLILVSANSWYFKAERDIQCNTTVTYEYEDGEGTITPFTPENTLAIMDEVPAYTVDPLNLEGVTNFEALRNALSNFEIGEIDFTNIELPSLEDIQNTINSLGQAAIINAIEMWANAQLIMGNITSIPEAASIINYYILRIYDEEHPEDEYAPYSFDLDSSYSQISNIEVTSGEGQRKKLITTTTDTLVAGVLEYTDNTDAFLGLWKNSSGEYEEGATFDPDGKIVGYTDLYTKENKNAYVGELFVNADQMLFDLLEYSEKTQSYSNVMKYILYRYSGTDYGIMSFDDLMKLLGYNTRSISGFYGNSVQEKVWWALINSGYSKIAAAGVLGNIENESGFDPAKIEGGTGIGLGLCQWSYGRRTQLEAYIASKGTDTSDVNTQIEFLLAELTPGGGANGYAHYQMGGRSSSRYDGRRYTKSDWENATDIRTATVAFMALFERPSYDPNINHMSRRIQSAQNYYDQFKDLEQPTTDDRIGPMGLSGDNAATMGAMLTEALRIADDDRYYYSQENRMGEFSYDCSSFVYRLYREFFGITLPLTTRGNYSANAVYESSNMSASNLQPGDVLWRTGHVALYLGNGQYVHASSTRTGIKVSTYRQGAFTKMYRYVR